MAQLSNRALPQSRFVTALAWTFIAITGFTTLISVLQNIMLALVFPVEQMRETMQVAQGAEIAPAFARFMFEHIRLFFASFLIVSVVTLISAIGLLKRRNWARLIFIGIMGLGIAWNLAGVAILPFFATTFPPMPDYAPSDFDDKFDVMWKIMMIFTIVMTIAFTVLFGWIIKRLVSREVREEFLAL